MNDHSGSLKAYHSLLLINTLFIAMAIFLRRVQLLQPDPYNNPYTTWSSGLLLGYIGSWLVGLAWSIILLSRGQRLGALSWIWFAASIVYSMWFFINLGRMVFMP